MAKKVGNGWKTAITTTMSGRHRTGRPGHRAIAVAARFVAVPGSAMRGASARLTAAGKPPSGTAASVSSSRERLRLDC